LARISSLLLMNDCSLFSRLRRLLSISFIRASMSDLRASRSLRSSFAQSNRPSMISYSFPVWKVADCDIKWQLKK
jgi:hypothetical protein